MNRGYLLIGLAAFLPGSLWAQIDDYSYVEGGIASMDVGSLDLFGFGFAGSVELTEQFFARGSFRSMSDEVNGIDVDTTEWALGGGYVFYEMPGSSVYAGAEVVGFEFEAGTANVDDDGYAVFLGIRNELVEVLEFNGELNLAKIDDDTQTSVTGRIIYSLQNGFAVVGGLSSVEGDRLWTLGVRYDF